MRLALDPIRIASICNVLVYYLLIWTKHNSLWLLRTLRILKSKFTRGHFLFLCVIRDFSCSTMVNDSFHIAAEMQQVSNLFGNLTNNFTGAAARLVPIFLFVVFFSPWIFAKSNWVQPQSETEEKPSRLPESYLYILLCRLAHASIVYTLYHIQAFIHWLASTTPVAIHTRSVECDGL